MDSSSDIIYIVTEPTATKFEFVPIYTYSYARYLERFNFYGFWSFYARVANKRQGLYQFSFFLRNRGYNFPIFMNF